MYQILINKSSKPVLIEILKYEKTISFIEGSSKDITEEFNQTIIQQSISDESKHIQFKDWQETLKILLAGLLKTEVPNNIEVDPESRFCAVNMGKIFSIPEGYRIDFFCNADCDTDHGECCHPSCCPKLAILERI